VKFLWISYRPTRSGKI